MYETVCVLGRASAVDNQDIMYTKTVKKAKKKQALGGHSLALVGHSSTLPIELQKPWKSDARHRNMACAMTYMSVCPSLTFTRASLQCWYRYSVHPDIITLSIWRLCLDLAVFSS